VATKILLSLTGEKFSSIVAVQHDGPTIVGFDNAQRVTPARYMNKHGPTVCPLFDEQIVLLTVRVEDDPQVTGGLLNHNFRRFGPIHVVLGIGLIERGKDEGNRPRLVVRHGVKMGVAMGER
jgi:hypothetical protein